MVVVQGEGVGGESKGIGKVVGIQCSVVLDPEGVEVGDQTGMVPYTGQSMAHVGGGDMDQLVVVALVAALVGTGTGFEGGWVGGEKGCRLDWSYY